MKKSILLPVLAILLAAAVLFFAALGLNGVAAANASQFAAIAFRLAAISVDSTVDSGSGRKVWMLGMTDPVIQTQLKHRIVCYLLTRRHIHIAFLGDQLRIHSKTAVTQIALGKAVRCI